LGQQGADGIERRGDALSREGSKGRKQQRGDAEGHVVIVTFGG
jgi:hypothetical protein